MTKIQIENRINELKQTRALVGSDEGTSSSPRTFRIFENFDGRRYALKSFAGSNGVEMTEQEAAEMTEGRIIYGDSDLKVLRENRAEVKKLQKLLA